MAAIALAAKETTQKELHPVVIAAAVAAVFGCRARIRSITEVTGSSLGVVVPLRADNCRAATAGERRTSRWVRQGRADIHASHNGNGLGMRAMGTR